MRVRKWVVSTGENGGGFLRTGDNSTKQKQPRHDCRVRGRGGNIDLAVGHFLSQLVSVHL